MFEPVQAVISEYPSLFKSAMLVGDVVRMHTKGPLATLLVSFLFLISYLSLAGECNDVPLYTMCGRSSRHRRGFRSSFKEG